MDTDILVIATFATMGIASIMLVTCLGWAAYRWRDPLSVSEAASATGVVDLEGTADCLQETVRTPFTDTACLAYECTIEEFPAGQTVYESVDAVPFLVTDGESLLVDPRGANLAFEVVESVMVDAGEKPPEPFASFARESYGAPLVADSHRRFQERRLDVGESVRVRGTVIPDPIIDSSAASYRPIVGKGDAGSQHVVWDSSANGPVREFLEEIVPGSGFSLRKRVLAIVAANLLLLGIAALSYVIT